MAYQFKLWRLMLAMAAHEGWTPLGLPADFKGSASYRRHNPGNMRSSPFQAATEGGFAVFINDQMGWMAFQYDLVQKAKGNTSTGLNANSTLRDLIYKWAPPADNNNSEAYLQSVVQMSGLPATTKLGELLEGIAP